MSQVGPLWSDHRQEPDRVRPIYIMSTCDSIELVGVGLPEVFPLLLKTKFTFEPEYDRRLRRILVVAPDPPRIDLLLSHSPWLTRSPL